MIKLIKYFDYFEKFFYFIAKLAVFAMMLTTTADAVARYLFNSPIIGAYEFTESYLMVVAVFLSLSYVMKIGGHIKVDMLVEHLPEPLVKVLNFVFLIAGALFMAVVGYQGALATEDAWINNYVAAGLIAWPTWLSLIWVPIGSFLFMLRLIMEVIKMAMGINYDIEEATSEEEIAVKIAMEMNSNNEGAANAAMEMDRDNEKVANHNANVF